MPLQAPPVPPCPPGLAENPLEKRGPHSVLGRIAPYYTFDSTRRFPCLFRHPLRILQDSGGRGLPAARPESCALFQDSRGGGGRLQDTGESPRRRMAAAGGPASDSAEIGELMERAAQRVSGLPPPFSWPEAERQATGRGRSRASSASARRPSRARARGRNRPRRPTHGRARVPPCRTPARLARVRRSARATSRRAAHRILARSAARGVLRRRLRARDPSRQRRVSRDRRPRSRPNTVSRIGGAVPARGVRAAAGPPPELEQVPVQAAYRAPTP